MKLTKAEREAADEMREMLTVVKPQFKDCESWYRHNRAEIVRQGGIPVAAEWDAGGNCTICGEAGRCPGYHDKRTIRIDRTEAGDQTLIADTPARVVPVTRLKPKRAQTEKPTLLELYQEEVKQRKLF